MGVVSVFPEFRNSGKGGEKRGWPSPTRVEGKWVIFFRGGEVVFEKYVTSKLNPLTGGCRRAAIH